jgi:hypothetical protein
MEPRIENAVADLSHPLKALEAAIEEPVRGR